MTPGFADTNEIEGSKTKEWRSDHFIYEDRHPDSYESFLVLSHASYFGEAVSKNADIKSSYFNLLDTYFVELKRITEELSGDSPSEKNKKEISQITNYFGHACLFSVMRLYGIESPEMTHYVLKLMSIDPEEDWAEIDAWQEASDAKTDHERKRFHDFVFAGNKFPLHKIDDKEKRLYCKKKEIFRLAPEISCLVNELYSDLDCYEHVRRLGHIERRLMKALTHDIDLFKQSQKPA